MLLVVGGVLPLLALLGEDEGAAIMTTVTVGGIAEAAGKSFCKLAVMVAVPADREDVIALAGCVLATLYVTLTPVANTCRRTVTTVTLVMLTTLSTGSSDCNADLKDVRKELESFVTPAIVCTTFTVFTTAPAATGL